MVYIITSKKSRPKRGLVMSPQELERYLEKKKALEEQLNRKQKVYQGNFFVAPPQDPKHIKRHLQEIEHTLEQKAPQRLTTSREKDQLWKRAKEIIEEIRVGMPTKYEMHPLRINPLTSKINQDRETLERAVQKNIQWEERNKQKIIELKNIMRTLGHPELGNIERWRPKGTAQASRMVPGAKEYLNEASKSQEDKKEN